MEVPLGFIDDEHRTFVGGQHDAGQNDGTTPPSDILADPVQKARMRFHDRDLVGPAGPRMSCSLPKCVGAIRNATGVVGHSSSFPGNEGIIAEISAKRAEFSATHRIAPSKLYGYIFRVRQLFRRY